MWPEEMAGNQKEDHGPAEQAGPGLLEAEQQELIGEGVQARSLRPGPGGGVEGLDLALDHVLETHDLDTALRRRARL